MIIEDRQIGSIRMILGDMRTVAPMLQGQADLIMTDPPYLLTSGGKSTGEMGGIFAHGRYDNSGALFPIVPWAEMAPLLWAMCKPDADAIVMTSDREEGDARSALMGVGFQFHRLLVWDKITVTPNRFFMPNCEFGLYLWRGRAQRIVDCSAKQLVRVRQIDETDHPTEKPVALIWHWIRMCSRGGTVIDPFNWSGSTMVACASLGLPGIGIEVNPAFYEAACARVAKAVPAPRGANTPPSSNKESCYD